MSTTFILPFAIGACETLGGNVLTDAFGIVAMIAMTPLIAIQILGLLGEIKRKKQLEQAKSEILSLEDDMIYYPCPCPQQTVRVCSRTTPCTSV